MILVFKTICYRVYHISLFYLMFCKKKNKILWSNPKSFRLNSKMFYDTGYYLIKPLLLLFDPKNWSVFITGLYLHSLII